jgi:hypothetical protein
MSKSKSTRPVERAKPSRQPAEEVREPAPHLVPHPPARRRGLLIASLVLLAAWISFLVGLAIFGS